MSIKVPTLYLEIPEYDFGDEGEVSFIGRIKEWRKLDRKIRPACVDKQHTPPSEDEQEATTLINLKRFLFFLPAYVVLFWMVLRNGARKVFRRVTTSHRKKKGEVKYKGAYLVAGFRGIGKSTLVKKVIKKIKKDLDRHNLDINNSQRRLHQIDVFLSQGELSDYELLRQMFIQLHDEINSDLGSRNKLVPGLIALVVAASIVFSLLYFFEKSTETEKPIIEDVPGMYWVLENETLTIILVAFLYLILYRLLGILFGRFKVPSLDLGLRKVEVIDTIVPVPSFKWTSRKEVHLKNRLDITYSRVHSGLEVSDSSFSGQADSVESSFLGQIVDTLNSMGPNSSKKQTYEKITTKELEFELKQILKEYRKLNKGYVLFVIDELDKLEPEFNYEAYDLKDSSKSKIQNRRDSVAKMLANLKSFIHTSEAKFVFIGGAEMYDASLADIADRESFYSSIFHEVIYVNSFFKDRVGRRKGLSQMTEDYVVSNLIKGKKNRDDYWEQLEIDEYYRALQHIPNHNGRQSEGLKFYIVYLLRRLIIFLTYRSNGSPKKLKELFEYYLLAPDHRNKIFNEGDKEQLIVSYGSGNNSAASTLLIENQIDVKKTYLRLTYLDQYHIGFLYSSVVPYLLEKQRHFKLFNDKNLYLSAFLIDHIFKFHRSAFSWRELELMPDIILGSKGPNLREMMSGIINYMLEKHFLRETSNAMFQYKFRSRASTEFRYISKISDENAAAFNFTYDESYHLKTYFKNKLRSKKETSLETGIANNSLLSTISYLNSTIADLHYYDEEYDDAIRYYNDSIEPLNLTIKEAKGSMVSHNEKIQFLRNRLLVGLCFEKTERFYSTYSVIRSTMIQSYKWNFKVFEQEENSRKSKKKRKGNAQLANQPEYDKHWETPYKRLQLFLRPHLALLACIEKGRTDGITESNLRRNIEEYCNFMGLKNLFPLETFQPGLGYRDFFKQTADTDRLGDYKRVQTLLADYYQNIGSILFFKNRNFNSIHHKGAYGIWYQYFKLKNPNTDQEGTIEIYELNNKRLLVKGLRYSSLQETRNIFNKTKDQYFFPSFSSTFYFITALGHILSPYLENLHEIFGDEDFDLKCGKRIRSKESLANDDNNPVSVYTIDPGKEKNKKEIKSKKKSKCAKKDNNGQASKETEIFYEQCYEEEVIKDRFSLADVSSNISAVSTYKTIETVLYNKESIHILSGKTAQSMALVLSKLADSVLGSIGDPKDFKAIADYADLIGLGQMKPQWDDQNYDKYLFQTWGVHKNIDKGSAAGEDMEFDHFFSIQNVFYLTVLSHRCYEMAGLYYDSLFQVKKCLYILKTFVENFKEKEKPTKNQIDFIRIFKDWLYEKANSLIEIHIYKNLEREADYIKGISSFRFKKQDDPGRYYAMEKEEIFYLIQYIDLVLNPFELDKKFKALKRNQNLIDNVYTRIQEIRYNLFIYYLKIEKFRPKKVSRKTGGDVQEMINSIRIKEKKKKNFICFKFKTPGESSTKSIRKERMRLEEFIKIIDEINFCNRNLQNIMNTYGYSYIMSYSYVGAFHLNVVKVTQILDSILLASKGCSNQLLKELSAQFDPKKLVKFNKGQAQKREEAKKSGNEPSAEAKRAMADRKLLWDFYDMNFHRNQALDFFTKSVNLHSEGIEYKSMIKNMYILEDDFNDSLIHFCAALERSLVNTGVIEKKMKWLKDQDFE